MEIPTKDLNEFDEIEPNTSDNLVCGHGRFSIEALMSLILGGQNAIKVKIRRTSEYGYVVFERDSGGNISPTYLTEDEYNALN